VQKTSTRATRLGRDAGTTTGPGTAAGATAPGGQPHVAGADTPAGREARRHELTPAPTDPANWLG
jgi:hypothetical protein